jgi:DNA-binding response OmpR family regulator
MEILYVDPLGQCGPVKAELVRAGHRVTCATELGEAAKMLSTHCFSAVLLAEGVDDPEALAFISKVHHDQREVLVFQLSVWRSELAATLQSLETMPGADDRAPA